MNVTKQHYSQPIGRLWFTQAQWQVAGQLQLHCPSKLNPFKPCVCAFTYLSSSIIFTAGSSRSCCSVEYSIRCKVECSCKPCTWTRQYAEIHRAFQGIHGSRRVRILFFRGKMSLRSAQKCCGHKPQCIGGLEAPPGKFLNLSFQNGYFEAFWF